MIRIVSLLLGSILFLLGLRPLFTTIAPAWVGWIDLSVSAWSIVLATAFWQLRPSMARAAWPTLFALTLSAVWLASLYAGRHDGFVWWQLAVAAGYALVAALHVISRGAPTIRG